MSALQLAICSSSVNRVSSHGAMVEALSLWPADGEHAAAHAVNVRAKIRISTLS